MHFADFLIGDSSDWVIQVDESYSASYDTLYCETIDERDALGRITQRTETVGNETPVARKYEYDDAGRLYRVRDGSDTLLSEYLYDANGNRTGGFTPAGAILTAEYDDQDRLLTYNTTTATTAFTYTDNGELATKTENGDETEYAYDAFGNLRHVVLPNGREIEYVIDGQNRRIGKKISPAPGQPPELVQQWIYRDQLNPVAELDGAGNLVARFI